MAGWKEKVGGTYWLATDLDCAGGIAVANRLVQGVRAERTSLFTYGKWMLAQTTPLSGSELMARVMSRSKQFHQRHFRVATLAFALAASMQASALAQQNSTKGIRSQGTASQRTQTQGKTQGTPAADSTELRTRPANPLASASVQSPKVAYVTAAQAEVWSGPGEGSRERGSQGQGSRTQVRTGYRTSFVSRGSAVEVFHRTSGGWLGIRPPEGSFSWVMAKDAFLLPGGKTIEITGDKGVSWIGTELDNESKFRWQVQLSQGEKLVVLGESESKNTAGDQVLWYKVAPPSGEFRWIREEFVALEPPIEPGIARTIPSRSGQNDRQIQMAADGKGNGGRTNVTTAGYSQVPEVLDGSVLDGQVVDEQVLNGQVLNGNGSSFTMDDGRIVHDGDVVYLDGPHNGPGEYGPVEYGPTEYGPTEYIDEPGYALESVGRGGMWDGWHAVELTDEGFRIPFLERRFQQAHARRGIDPRNHDPFSLSMIRDVPLEPASIQDQVRLDTGVAPNRRYTPWRDPRELREQRMQGYPSARSTSRSAGPGSSERSSFFDDLSYDDATAEKSSTSVPDGSTATDLLSRFASALSSNSPTSTELDDSGTPALAAQKTSAGRATSAAQAAVSQRSLTGNASWDGLGDTRSNSAASMAQADAPLISSIDLLQVAVSEIAARPMESWDFASVTTDVRRLIEAAPTPVERGRARLLLERIEEFELLARKAGLPIGGVVTASSTSNINGSAVSAEHSVAPEELASLYDATGYLVPVHAAAVGQPSYALTKKDGTMIAYVSPLPGMKLDHYVNQAVGIKGLRGYLPQLQANHLQAQRIVRIER